MKTIYLITVLLLVSFFTGKSQQWEWVLTGTGVVNPKVASLNGDVYVTGTFQHSCSINNYPITSHYPESGFVAKFDGNGILQWDVSFGAADLEIAGIKTFESKIYIAGAFQGTLNGYSLNSVSNGSSDIFFLRISQSGTVEMVKTDGSPNFENVVSFDVDSTVVLLGQFEVGAAISSHTLNSLSPGNKNVYFANYTTTGANIWVKEIVAPQNSGCKAVFIKIDKNKDILFQSECGGEMLYVDTLMGQCELCRPMLRFHPTGLFKEFVFDAQSGIAQFRVSREIGIDNSNKIYNLIENYSAHSPRHIVLEKFAETGVQHYDRAITNAVYNPMGSGGNAIPHQLVVNGDKVFIGGTYSNKIYFVGGDTLNIGMGLFVSESDTAASFKHVTTASIYWADLNMNEINEMCVDNSNNVFITGTINVQAVFSNTLINADDQSDLFFLAKLGTQSVGLKENKLQDHLSVFPNPSNGKFVLQHNTTEEIEICVFDALGRCVFTKHASGAEVTVDMGRQNKGIYLVQVSVNGKMTRKKIIVD